MALILRDNVSGKKCWACGLEIRGDEAVIIATGARDLLYMHPSCAKSISQQLFKDIAQLIDLGYELEDE